MLTTQSLLSAACRGSPAAGPLDTSQGLTANSPLAQRQTTSAPPPPPLFLGVLLTSSCGHASFSTPSFPQLPPGSGLSAVEGPLLLSSQASCLLQKTLIIFFSPPPPRTPPPRQAYQRFKMSPLNKSCPHPALPTSHCPSNVFPFMVDFL